MKANKTKLIKNTFNIFSIFLCLFSKLYLDDAAVTDQTAHHFFVFAFVLFLFDFGRMLSPIQTKIN